MRPKTLQSLSAAKKSANTGGGSMAQLPAVIDTKKAIERYSSGETIRDIAKSIGCSHVALYNRLLTECPEEWKAIASSNALSDLDEAEDNLKTAPDMLSVTRA